MAILKMKKLRICGVSEEQTQLIRQLQLLGSVEIGAPCALTDTQGVQVFCAGDGKSADALLRTSARLTSALETLKHYETKKGGLFAARPEKTIGELFSDEAYAAALDTAQAVLDRRKKQADSRARELRAVAAAAAPAGDSRDAAHAHPARHRPGADRLGGAARQSL